LGSFGLSDGSCGLTMGAMCVSQKQKMSEGKNKNSLGRKVWLPVIELFFVFFFISDSLSRLSKNANNACW